MSGLWRSRWAAIGAAVAVTLGGGGLFAVQAASGPASSVVTIDPARILDTRVDLGLAGPFASGVSRKLQVTGAAGVPVGATGVLLNVTVVEPTAAGFVSVRPGDASGAPSTSSLNFVAGQTVPNAVQVALPTSGANAGQIDITYDALGVVGPTTEMLIDAVGYLVPSGGGAAGPAGPVGPAGPAGAQGPKGDKGDTGPGHDLARVVWVATSGGDYTVLSDAFAAIGTTLPAATETTPYVIKIAPGTYTETTPLALEDFVDVEGSGEGVTTLRCACGGAEPGGFLTAGNITVEIRDLTVENTGGGASAAALVTTGATDALRIRNVTARASGGTTANHGIHNDSSSPLLVHVDASASGGTESHGVYNAGTAAPTVRDSVLEGATTSIRNVDTARSDVIGTKLDGAVRGPTTSFRCVAAYNASIAELPSNCGAISDSTGGGVGECSTPGVDPSPAGTATMPTPV